jgi:uncharacterized protein YcbX
MSVQVGRVKAIRRYPVKSMQGHAVREGALDERGLWGDRAFAVQDVETGLIASAKHPKWWGCLLECWATFTQEPQLGQPLPPLHITLPDGRVILNTQPDCEAVLSEFIGRQVRLICQAPPDAQRMADRSEPEEEAYAWPLRREELALAAPAGTFFDHAPMHVLTTATLTHFQELYPTGQFDPIRFRPNLLIETNPDAQGFVENAWLGQRLVLEAGAQLNLIDPCPRCIITTLPQNGLPADRQILRTLAQHNQVAGVTLAPGHLFKAVAGVYATVIQPGTVRVGDAVYLS